MMFRLNPEQEHRFMKWQQTNEEKHGKYQGQYTFHFTPSKLGLMIVVECKASNEKLHLTDYKNFQ